MKANMQFLISDEQQPKPSRTF